MTNTKFLILVINSLIKKKKFYLEYMYEPPPPLKYLNTPLLYLIALCQRSLRQQYERMT